MNTTVVMATTVAILYCAVKILLHDFVNIYCRCASMKLDANLMQQVHSTHAETSTEHFICSMLQYEPYRCTMCMFRGIKQLLACNIAALINRN